MAGLVRNLLLHQRLGRFCGFYRGDQAYPAARNRRFV